MYMTPYTLDYKAVHLQSMTADGRVLTNGTGFLRREGKHIFLYTCWHFVTGLDPFDLKFSLEWVRREKLKLSMQASDTPGPGMNRVGGLQSLEIPLYDDEGNTVWLQEENHVPNLSVNEAGFYLPLMFDAVKIRLPNSLQVCELQLVADPPPNLAVGIGDRIAVVGYPHGYSSLGPNQPTPIVVTRFVASTKVEGAKSQCLIDGGCTPGMSGGPVFLHRRDEIYIAGIYTGEIYPDHATRAPEKHRAIGHFCVLGHLLFDLPPAMTRRPGTKVAADGSAWKD